MERVSTTAPVHFTHPRVPCFCQYPSGFSDVRTWQPTPVFLPGESPRTEEPGGLQSMGLQRVQHDCAAKHDTISLSSFTHINFSVIFNSSK